jgi:hypothetical protein
MIEAPAQQQISREAVNLSVNIHNQNSPYMSTENYSNTGTNQGIIGKGNTQNISGSFNTEGADIGALLQAVDRLQQAARKLPSSDADAIRPQLNVLEAGAKTIQAETEKDKPNRNLLDLTKDGMITAAKTCAAMAPSLLQAATAVAQWFV